MPLLRDISILAAPGDSRKQRNLKTTLTGAIWWLLISDLVILLYAAAAAVPGAGLDRVQTFLATFSSAGLVASGAFAVGALLGFLFGIPKTVAVPTQTLSATGNPAATQEVNTNLEQVSDWLTKILVGIGLTQFKALSDQVWNLAGQTPTLGPPVIALAVMLNFVITGFLGGYLITRLFLAGAFVDASRPDAELQAQTDEAKTLERQKDWGAALGAFETALAQVTPSTPTVQKLEIYEGAMYNALYQDPPEGFQKAIRYGTEFVRQQPGLASARLWAYLAAAYGQKYGYLQTKAVHGEELHDTRTRAFEAVKEALRTDPAIKELLRLMWDPKSPIKSPEDNDLEVFFEDPEFKALLA